MKDRKGGVLKKSTCRRFGEQKLIFFSVGGREDTLAVQARCCIFAFLIYLYLTWKVCFEKPVDCEGSAHEKKELQ